ncbi:Flp family type IVb pilin [Pontibacterium sp.]|uniref:Flp family type IVb pilin n=1 Tax=Pontibacterium sp. TaxID=2036026 RepID=UPI0035127984
MMTLKEKLIAFLKEEEGLTTVEYAIAGSLVAATVIVAFQDLGTGVDNTISNLAECLNSAADGTCPS